MEQMLIDTQVKRILIQIVICGGLFLLVKNVHSNGSEADKVWLETEANVLNIPAPSCGQLMSFSTNLRMDSLGLSYHFMEIADRNGIRTLTDYLSLSPSELKNFLSSMTSDWSLNFHEDLSKIKNAYMTAISNELDGVQSYIEGKSSSKFDYPKLGEIFEHHEKIIAILVKNDILTTPHLLMLKSTDVRELPGMTLSLFVAVEFLLLKTQQRLQLSDRRTLYFFVETESLITDHSLKQGLRNKLRSGSVNSYGDLESTPVSQLRDFVLDRSNSGKKLDARRRKKKARGASEVDQHYSSTSLENHHHHGLEDRSIIALQTEMSLRGKSLPPEPTAIDDKDLQK